jgi:dihydroorotase
MTSTLIVNARLVNEGREFDGDLRFADGRIGQIGSGLAARAGETVIDAAGRRLLPGMIDDQVHFREPGMEYKADMAIESAAAVAGGLTSFMDMPNTNPPTLNREALEDKYRRAEGRCRANYGFYMGASNDNLADVRKIDPRATPGLKVFMGASTGNMLVDNPETLDAIFRDTPVPIITHCEDTPTIDANLAAFKAIYGEDIPVECHPDIRSREACIKSTRLALSLANKHGTQLHVLHISTADELALFEQGPLIRADGSRKKITAETCVHFLRFARGDYARLGNLIKCNPAIKDEADREAIIDALAGDILDVLATDHAPHTLEEKQVEFTAAAYGILGLECALPLYKKALIDSGAIDWPKLIAMMTINGTELCGLTGKGKLSVGADADVTIIDPEQAWTIDVSRFASKSRNCPFDGWNVTGRAIATIVGGNIKLALDPERIKGGNEPACDSPQDLLKPVAV